MGAGPARGQEAKGPRAPSLLLPSLWVGVHGSEQWDWLEKAKGMDFHPERPRPLQAPLPASGCEVLPGGFRRTCVAMQRFVPHTRKVLGHHIPQSHTSPLRPAGQLALMVPEDWDTRDRLHPRGLSNKSCISIPTDRTRPSGSLFWELRTCEQLRTSENLAPAL